MSKNIGAIKHTLRRKLKACYEEACDYMERMRKEPSVMKKAYCLFMAKTRMVDAGQTLVKLHALTMQEKKLQEYRRRYDVKRVIR